MHFYFGRKGEPVSREKAYALFEDPTLRIVGKTRVGQARVSTVHLVVKHPCYTCELAEGFCSEALFETMIFGGPLSERQWRYHTLAEAVRGHAEAVKLAESLLAKKRP